MKGHGFSRADTQVLRNGEIHAAKPRSNPSGSAVPIRKVHEKWLRSRLPVIRSDLNQVSCITIQKLHPCFNIFEGMLPVMSHRVAELIGTLAGTCTTVSLIPQLLRIWRGKSAHDISLVMFTIFGLGILLWLVYGIGVKSPAVILTNAASLTLAAAILTLSIRYQRGQ